MYDPDAILQIKQSTSTKICTGENLFYMREYIPYFQRHAADIFMIDVPWNGFSQSKKVGDLAEVYQLNVAPHNYYSHLADFISASLCAVLPNVRIMETDVDDVPWKRDLVTVAAPDCRRPHHDPHRPRLGHRSERGGRPRARLAARHVLGGRPRAPSLAPPRTSPSRPFVAFVD